MKIHGAAFAADGEQASSINLRIDSGSAIADGQNNTGHESELLKAGSSPWFFTCDDHMIWRAKNMFVHTMYEQGLMGLAFLVAVIALAWRGLGASDSADSDGTAALNRSVWGVSLVGLVVVGQFATLLDTAWITAWFIALLVNRASSG